MQGIIYKATNIINGKSYIGRTMRSLEERKRCHLCASKNSNNYKAVFYKAIRKYGFNSFNWEIIETCLSYEDLELAEEWYIRLHNTFIPGGYNMSCGGGSNKGWKMPKESRLKIRNARLGTKQPDSVRFKISQSNFKSQSKVDRNGCNNPMYGRKGESSPTAKNFIVTYPDGKEERVKGIKEFSRLNDLDSSAMVKCAKGKYKTHKGYRCRYLKEGL
jgi:group I intron endonuclease